MVPTTLAAAAMRKRAEAVVENITVTKATTECCLDIDKQMKQNSSEYPDSSSSTECCVSGPSVLYMSHVCIRMMKLKRHLLRRVRLHSSHAKPSPPPPMDEPVKDGFLRLSDEIIEEVFFRLPPDEAACLVRASAVRKRWRRILADAGFRRRYREFHGTPPVLGLFQEDASFIPTSALPPVRPDRSRWVDMVPVDCRHGRALFTRYTRYIGERTCDLTVVDPLTGRHRRVPFPCSGALWFSAAVLCAAQDCDHHCCQGGHFRLAFVTTVLHMSVILGWLYSSETRTWSELTSVHHPNVTYYSFNRHVPSVLVGDALYFNIDGIIKCDLGTRCLSMFERPTNVKGHLMTTEDGGLGFAAVVDDTNLTLWSMETGTQEGMGWAKLRVIDLNTLLPDGALHIPAPPSEYVISCIAEGSQVIFISNCGCYMVDLKSGRARNVSPPCRKFVPYMSFYMPAMKAASTSQGQ